MKKNNFDGVDILMEDVSPRITEVITLVANKEYDIAFKLVDEFISQTNNVKRKNVEAMLGLQILALAGYGDIASVLLEALLKNFKIYSKARHLCKETIKAL